MSDLTHGDRVTVTTETINGGDSFEASVLTVDPRTETVAVDPITDLTIEMAIVGLSEVEN